MILANYSIFDLIGPIGNAIATHPLFCHSEPCEESPNIEIDKNRRDSSHGSE
jgi:hypothetical protein